MANNAYIKPGVTVDELVSPNLAPVLDEPTSICIIGPAQGFENRTEIALLDDNVPYELKATNANLSTISVVDESNVTLDPFVAVSDYIVDSSQLSASGKVSIRRAMQTAIANGQEVVIYHENAPGAVYSQADSFTSVHALTRTNKILLLDRSADTDDASIVVMSQGLVVDDNSEYTITGAGTGTVEITRVSSAAVLQRFQKLYVDFENASGNMVYDQMVQLDWNVTDQGVSLPANSTNHVIKTAPGTQTAAAVVYQRGVTVDKDYVVTGTGTDTAISRSVGTTTMGVAADRLQVRISYQATPNDYWLPTRVFSQADVEEKYGPAFAQSGDINSALSFAAQVCFENGASNVILQALFKEGSPRQASDGAVSDFQDTLNSLRNVEAINVIVPLVNSGGLTHTDDEVYSIFNHVRNHIDYMASQDQFIVGMFGEDGTGTAGSASILQEHAEALGLTPQAESMVLISPGSFTYSNPVTAVNINIGGQYVAAMAAGQLAGRPLQDTLTRKPLSGVNGINVLRSEREKDEDASTGLMVVETRGGIVRVRHAVTTAVANISSSIAQRELNVVRAKHYVMESVRDALDQQIVGNIVADARAAFTVQVLVSNILERMVGDGIIVTYDPSAVQARQLVDNPATVEIRFSYVPSFPLNNIQVKFSLDTSTGALISEVQTQGV